MGFEDVYWIYVTKDNNQWQVHVNKVTSMEFHKTQETCRLAERLSASPQGLFPDNRITDGVKVFSLMHQPQFTRTP